ncbi:MAG: hypothetical protein NZ700_11470 [Gemmataceae bacterium]|nr:hypothetical protein [Gemmataceae bacterium]MDW8265565.1 hypothetical protein [Gemmataceae bacterium]
MSFAEPKRLTSDGQLKMDPVFVEGGEAIVYTVQESPTMMSLMKVSSRGGKPERLHPEATTAEFEATFSADGRYYAFVQSRGNLNLKLVIRDTKEKKDAVFDPGGGFASIRRPSFAPDGSRLALSIPAANGQKIITLNNQGQDRKDLTGEGVNNHPAWSPDGKRIAFVSSRDGDFEIYTMAPDGSEVRRLTQNPSLDIRPAWSPDSRRLAFTSNRSGSYDIWLMKADDGSGLVRLTTNPERDDYPAWHPNGRQLVMVSERNGQFDLFLVDVPE